jgi:uncharacterized alpha-E superfamily protein
MLKVNYISSQENLKDFSWDPILRIFTYAAEKDWKSLSLDSREVLVYMVGQKENENSVINMVARSRENARSVQDHITKEVWQTLNDFYHITRTIQMEEKLRSEDPVGLLDSLIKQCMIYYGVVDITMGRGEGLNFMNIGKLLERAFQSVDILDIKFSDVSYDLNNPAQSTYWKYLLYSVSGYELYLKSYKGALEPKNIVHQIILNADFPRSLHYSITKLHLCVEKISNHQGMKNQDRLQFILGKLKSRIQYSNIEGIAEEGLHSYLKKIKNDLILFNAELNECYFAY